MAKFIDLFPRIALPLSLLVALILTVPLVAFSLWLGEGVEFLDVPGQSALSAAIVHHPLVFTCLWWAFSVVGVSGSIGLMRRKRWGAAVWAVLFGILAIWSLTVVISETVNLATTGLGRSSGHLPSFPVMSALGAIPVSLVFGLASVILLRKLVACHRELTSSGAGG